MQFWNGSVHIGSHRADEAEMYEHVDGCDYGFYSCQYCNIRMLMAVTTDFTVANIATFGMCQSIANPAVSSATSAAMGVLTPMPCVPVITAPWSPGSSQVKVGGIAALTNNSKCMCSYGGNISITSPGNTAVTGQ